MVLKVTMARALGRICVCAGVPRLFERPMWSSFIWIADMMKLVRL